MSLGQCWDCPTSALHALFQVMVALGLLGVMVRLVLVRSMALRVVGALGTAFGLLVYLFIGVGFFRFGVAWHANEFPSRVAQVFVVGFWLAATAFLLFRLQQSYRRRQSPLVSGV